MHTQARQYSKIAYLCGNILEEYSYSQPVFRNLTAKTRNPFPGCGLRVPKPRSLSSSGRTKKRIRRLVNSNPGMDKFLTLTFADNVKSLRVANYEFKKFRQKYKRYMGRPMKYVAVPEFQKRGAVHYHLMADIPFLPKATYDKIWGHGFTWVETIRDKRKTGAYLAKYIIKGKFEDLRYYGQKAYFYSRKLLLLPVVLVDNFIDAVKIFCYSKCVQVKEYLINSEFRGDIMIRYFNLS